MTSIAQIQAAVAEHYHLDPSVMRAPSGRDRSYNPFEVSFPRQVAMTLARQLTHHSFNRIGHHFGGRDHSTVIYAVRQIEWRCRRNPAFADEVDALRVRLAV